MKKGPALLISFLVTLLVLANYLFIRNAFSKEIVIERVIDGDTFQYNNQSYRLLNINSPEKSSPLSNLSFHYLKKWEGKKVSTSSGSKDLYGRSLVKVYSPEYINLEMVRLGLANKYLVSESEKKLFSMAEEEAISKNRGIWNKSGYYGCIKMEMSMKEEKIVLTNKCEKVNLKGWTLKDESRKSFSLADIQLNKLIIHFEVGKSNDTDLFLDSRNPVLNDDSETVYLFDNEYRLAAHLSEGY